MFTGLVETVGRVAAATGESPRRLAVESDLDVSAIAIGASIAIDGCCLTVVEREDHALTFEAATETLERTTVGALRPGDRVNLEQALTLEARLGGHLVMGHVDGVGEVVDASLRDSALFIGVDAPAELAKYIAPQGSITISGVSLTVTRVEGRRFYVGLIPHTRDVTAPGPWELGARVNLEVDVIARYLERLLTARADEGPSLTLEALKSKGF